MWCFCVVNKCREKLFVRDTHYRKRGWELGVRDWDRDRVSKGNFQTDTDSDSQPGEQHRAQGEREREITWAHFGLNYSEWKCF